MEKNKHDKEGNDDADLGQNAVKIAHKKNKKRRRERDEDFKKQGNA